MPGIDTRPDAPHVFYVYRDASGTEHIANSLKAVPKAFRARARVWVMQGDGEEHHSPAIDDEGLEGNEGIDDLTEETAETLTAIGTTNTPDVFHLPSFMLGGGVVAAVVAVVMFARKKTGWLTRAVLFAAIAAAVSAAYLGWVRRQAGLDDGVLSHPAEVVNDAQSVVRQLERRMLEERKALEQLERESP